jgi:hypothetical protein
MQMNLAPTAVWLHRFCNKQSPQATNTSRMGALNWPMKI